MVSSTPNKPSPGSVFTPSEGASSHTPQKARAGCSSSARAAFLSLAFPSSRFRPSISAPRSPLGNQSPESPSRRSAGFSRGASRASALSALSGFNETSLPPFRAGPRVTGARRTVLYPAAARNTLRCGNEARSTVFYPAGDGSPSLQPAQKARERERERERTLKKTPGKKHESAGHGLTSASGGTSCNPKRICASATPSRAR